MKLAATEKNLRRPHEIVLVAVFVILTIDAATAQDVTYTSVKVTNGAPTYKGTYRFGNSDVLIENSPDGSNYSDLQFKNWTASGYINTLRINSNGHVGIGTTTPLGDLQIIGRPGWDTSTKFYLTNGSSDYGRTNLIITGRLQAGNDSWYFGSGGRSSIVFNTNNSSSGQGIGAEGAEQFSIQHELVTNKLGILTATKGNSPVLAIDQQGNVGMGTSAPSAALHISGTYERVIRAETTDNGYASLELGSNGKRWQWSKRPGTDADAMQLYYHNGTSWSQPNLTIRTNGYFGIGTVSPDEKLTVKGKIHAEEVRVDTSVPVPDYVFDSSYDLPSLSAVESYINENKHLPEIPSAKEIEANGLKLGEMEMLLLKKIEELTLHLIKQEKRIQSLEKENIQLKQNISNR